MDKEEAASDDSLLGVDFKEKFIDSRIEMIRSQAKSIAKAAKQRVMEAQLHQTTVTASFPSGIHVVHPAAFDMAFREFLEAGFTITVTMAVAARYDTAKYTGNLAGMRGTIFMRSGVELTLPPVQGIVPEK